MSTYEELQLVVSVAVLIVAILSYSCAEAHSAGYILHTKEKRNQKWHFLILWII